MAKKKPKSNKVNDIDGIFALKKRVGKEKEKEKEIESGSTVETNPSIASQTKNTKSEAKSANVVVVVDATQSVSLEPGLSSFNQRKRPAEDDAFSDSRGEKSRRTFVSCTFVCFCFLFNILLMFTFFKSLRTVGRRVIVIYQ